MTATTVAGVIASPTCLAADLTQTVRATNYSIKAGDLGQALDALAAQGNVRLTYPPGLVAGKQTAGLSGRLLPEAALRTLLHGTGIAPHRISATAFALRPIDPARTEDPPQQASSPPSTPTGKSKSGKKPATLKTIMVTGSLIPQSQIETAVPVITLHPEELQKQGFGSVYTALRAQPLATGSVVGSQTATGFTPGAETISLLGLSPGFTLYLVNGHPMTSYPLLYTGESNFVNIGDIPMGMVDHIDIVPGNLSSIYGSSAIAGVVNIVLKQHMNGYELNVREGGYTSGGGQNERLQFIGGYNTNKLNVIYAVQLEDQKPIWGYQRFITSGGLANPDPSLRYGYYTFLHEYLNPSYYPVYEDPGSACNALSGLIHGTTKRWSQPNTGLPLDPDTGAPTGPGYYCGSIDYNGQYTILNKVRTGDGYLNVKYHLNGNTELYASVLYGVNEVHQNYGFQAWESVLDNGGFFWNAATNRYEQLWHAFAPEEAGGAWKATGQEFLQRSYNAWAGVRGDAGDIHYDLYYARSQETLDEKINWLLTDKVNAFFQQHVLGPLLGTTSGYPIYDPNLANFYKPLTPTQYASINGVQRDHNETWVQTVNAHISDDSLFSLPGGEAGFAAILQYGKQMWSNPTDPRVVAGDFYGLTGTQGFGKRAFWAAGGEFRAPVFKMLTLDLSGRYDRYSNQGGGTDGQATYRLGVEFRPFSTLLLRANYSTAFRAPDMAYVFGGKSGSFHSGYTDYYRCDLFGGPLTQCPYYTNQSFFELHYGNRDLKSVTAKSYSGGVVWSPTEAFDVKADYYNIKIGNEVELQSEDALLRTEAACRTGQMDANSATCIAAISQVERYAPGSPNPNALKQLTVLPINIASERVSGIVASLDYSLGLGRFGNLKFSAHYNVTLNHTFQQSPGDQPTDLLRSPNLNPYSTEFKTIASGSLTWDIGKWSTTLYGTRYGKTPNWAAYNDGYGTDLPGYNGQAAGSVPPWILYNGSVTYHVTPKLQVSAIVNNIQNSGPPRDESYVSWPYYNNDNYNPYGREVWVELDWRFGQH